MQKSAEREKATVMDYKFIYADDDTEVTQICTLSLKVEDSIDEELNLLTTRGLTVIIVIQNIKGTTLRHVSVM